MMMARVRCATTFSKLGVEFLGLGYYTEQNTDGIPSFVHCSLLRKSNHTLHQKSWGGPSNFLGEGGPNPRPPPPVVAPLARVRVRRGTCPVPHSWPTLASRMLLPLYRSVYERQRVGAIEHHITDGGRSTRSARRAHHHWRSLVEAGPQTAQDEHGGPIGLEHDDQHVLDGVEEQAVAEDAETEAVETQREERSILEDDDGQQTPELGVAAAPLRHAVHHTSTAAHLRRQPSSTGLDRRQHDGELQQAAGPDGEDDVLQRAAGAHQRLVEEVEQFHDVEGDAEVDEQELRQLIAADDALGQHPASDDEDEQCQLLYGVDERLPVEQTVERQHTLFSHKQTTFDETGSSIQFNDF